MRLAALILPFLIFLFQGCTNLLFQPSRQQYLDPAARGLVIEDLYIQSEPGIRLHGWRIPAAGKRRATVLFLHGNGENISSHIAGVHWLSGQGFEVILFDYRGYGRSTGKPEIDGVMRDTVNMISYAVEHACSEPNRLVVMGHSLGGSLAIHATAYHPHKESISALLAISTFSDYRRITRDALSTHWFTRLLKWPLSYTISGRYSPARSIPDIGPVPVYIMHSDDDEIVPPYHANVLFAAARQPKRRLTLQGTHNLVLGIEGNRASLLNVLDRITTTTAACTAP